MQMLTFAQHKAAKASRRLTQKQRADIVDVEVARTFVLQALKECLAVNGRAGGLSKEELDRIFNDQPVHFDDTGYAVHWFARPHIDLWAKQMWYDLQSKL